MMGLSITNALGLDLWSAPISTADGDFSSQLKLHVDLLGLFFHIVFLSVALLVIIASRGYLKKNEPHQAEYYSLMMLAVVGMMFVAISTDLIVIYLCFELSGICTFALTAFRKKDEKASEASMKFFIIGAISSAIILFGISLIYGVTGSSGLPATMDLQGINTGIENALPAMEPPVIIGIVFLLAGFGFKVAIVPFHMWAPDVYEGAPTTITAFLAAGSKKVGIVALFKIFLVALLVVQVDWLIAIAILAIATQTVANIVAITQKSVKRMLAYSSIAHAGYILTAIIVGSLMATTSPGQTDYQGKLDVASYSMAGGLYHVLTHAIMAAGTFLVVAATVTAKIGGTFDDFKGLARRAPLLAISMSILLLSLAGIPPLGGFFSKFVLFSSAVNAGAYNAWFIALAISGVLNSALSLYYYARLIWYMYIMEPTRKEIPKISTSILLPVVICLIAIVLVGIMAQPFISYAQEAARGFFVP